MTKKILCLMLSSFIWGCTIAQLNNNKNIQIRLEHKRNTDSWKVDIKLPSKVKALVFNRQTNSFRENNWVIIDKDLEIRNIEGKEYIVSKTEANFSSVSLTHKSYYDYTPKDYEFFLKYSRGDVLMYTGHYDVLPIYKDFNYSKGIADENWPESTLLSEYNLIPDQNEKIVILGKVFEQKKVQWIDISQKGTYVYWGNSEPLETSRFIAVVDEKVPSWLSLSVKENLPKLFDLYTRKTGMSLSFKPVIFLSYEGEGEEGLSNVGGTLPGLVQLTLKGKDWKKKNSESFEYLYKFLAHEAAHLWNGQMFNYTDGKHSWMHEGGADAFAYRAMLELKIINNEKYLEYINTALNKCILGLDGSYPLIESANHRSFENYYYCGSTIGLITELALKEGNLFHFWSSLFRDAQDKDYKYSDIDYLNNFEKMAKLKALRSNLDTLIYGPFSNTGAILRDVFNKLGIKTGPLVKNKKDIAKRAVKNLLSGLYKKDCSGSLNLTQKKDFYLAHGDELCRSFKKNFKIQKIGRYHIFNQVEKAFEFVRISCRKKKFIELVSVNSARLVVPCEEIFGSYSFFDILKL